MKKVILVFPAVFIAAVALVVAVQINWGYHVKKGITVAAGTVDEFHLYDDKASAALASEVCGENVPSFGYTQRNAWWIAMPEHKELRHFFIRSPFREVVWVGVGVEDKYCLARYEVIARDRGYVCWMPTRLLPYPWFNWVKLVHVERRTLIERIARPRVPDGIKSLLPGECARGRIDPGQEFAYRVTVPRLGQPVEFEFYEDRFGEARLAMTVRAEDGREIPGILKTDENGGGTYDIVVNKPTAKAKHYRLQVNWSNSGIPCPHPEGWRDN